MATIPNPGGLSFEFWAAQVYDTFPATVPLPVTEKDWRFWARATCGALQVTAWTLPGPDLFETWQDWARQFIFSYPNKGM